MKRPPPLLLVLVLVLAGCGGEEERNAAPSTTPAAPHEPPAAPSAPPSADGPRAEDESFVLEARLEEGEYAAGELGRFALVIEGKEGWHLNHDFPVSVELSGEASFPKASLAKTDAAEFVDERARFEVPFTAEAGEHEVRAVVAFAMCNPTSCVPKSEIVTLALNVR